MKFKKKTKNIFNISKNILLNIFNMIETRIKLLSYETQELKKNIIFIFIIIEIIFILINLIINNLMKLIFFYFNINNTILKIKISTFIYLILLILTIIQSYVYIKNIKIFNITLKELKKDKKFFKNKILNLFKK